MHLKDMQVFHILPSKHGYKHVYIASMRNVYLAQPSKDQTTLLGMYICKCMYMVWPQVLLKIIDKLVAVSISAYVFTYW